MSKNNIDVSHYAPSFFLRLIHWPARLLFRLLGWEAVPMEHDFSKCIAIAAPHTSNWDGFYMLLLSFVLQIKFYWMGKDKLFRFPLGGILKSLGGIPINRRSSHNVVEQVIQAFEKSEQLILIVPPEGTRRTVKYWKTGFYHIAMGAGVPIVLGFLDYSRKRGGFGPAFMPTGDIEADMEVIRDFFADKVGYYPDRMSEIQIDMDKVRARAIRQNDATGR